MSWFLRTNMNVTEAWIFDIVNAHLFQHLLARHINYSIVFIYICIYTLIDTAHINMTRSCMISLVLL